MFNIIRRNASILTLVLFLVGSLFAMLYVGATQDFASSTPAKRAAAVVQTDVTNKCLDNGLLRIGVTTDRAAKVTITGIGDKSVTATVDGTLYLRTDANLYTVFVNNVSLSREPFRNPCNNVRLTSKR